MWVRNAFKTSRKESDVIWNGAPQSEHSINGGSTLTMRKQGWSAIPFRFCSPVPFPAGERLL